MKSPDRAKEWAVMCGRPNDRSRESTLCELHSIRSLVRSRDCASPRSAPDLSRHARQRRWLPSPLRPRARSGSQSEHWPV